jgi:hypothetical protein
MYADANDDIDEQKREFSNVALRSRTSYKHSSAALVTIDREDQLPPNAMYGARLQRGFVPVLPPRTDVRAWPNRDRLSLRRRLCAIPPQYSSLETPCRSDFALNLLKLVCHVS